MTGPRLHKEQAQARREPSAAAATDASSLRNSPYTAEALLKAWNRFIIDNPHEVILVNAMRVSRPQAADTANHTYTMTVINDVQQAKVLEFMPQIVRYLRDALSNDRIEIDVIVNNGEDNASTWNEREVLAHMIENNPALRSFIEEFKLKPG